MIRNPLATNKKTLVRVGHREIELSNLEKVLYPKSGFTKAQAIDYYRRIAPMMLPHLKNRPVTLKRYPDGVQGESFFEKNCPAYRPGWVKTTKIYVSQRHGKIDFCLANDLPTLMWLANLASLELHTSLSKAANIKQPTMMIFDSRHGKPQCSGIGEG